MPITIPYDAATLSDADLARERAENVAERMEWDSFDDVDVLVSWRDSTGNQVGTVIESVPRDAAFPLDDLRSALAEAGPLPGLDDHFEDNPGT